EHAGTPSAVVVPLDVDMEQFTAKLLPTELREHVLMLAEVGAIEAEKVTTSFVGIGADTVRLVCTGIGASQAGNEEYRHAVGEAVRDIPAAEAIAVVSPSTATLRAVTEGAALGAYRFDRYKTDAAPGRPVLAVVAAEANGG